MKNQPVTVKNHENRPGTITNQPGTMKSQPGIPKNLSGSGLWTHEMTWSRQKPTWNHEKP